MRNSLAFLKSDDNLFVKETRSFAGIVQRVAAKSKLLAKFAVDIKQKDLLQKTVDNLTQSQSLVPLLEEGDYPDQKHMLLTLSHFGVLKKRMQVMEAQCSSSFKRKYSSEILMVAERLESEKRAARAHIALKFDASLFAIAEEVFSSNHWWTTGCLADLPDKATDIVKLEMSNCFSARQIAYDQVANADEVTAFDDRCKKQQNLLQLISNNISRSYSDGAELLSSPHAVALSDQLVNGMNDDDGWLKSDGGGVGAGQFMKVWARLLKNKAAEKVKKRFTQQRMLPLMAVWFGRGENRFPSAD